VRGSRDAGKNGVALYAEAAFEDGAEDAALPPDFAGGELAVGEEAGELGAGTGAAGGAIVGLAGAEDEVGAVVIRAVGAVAGWAEELDVVDGLAVGAGDALSGEGLKDGPGVFGEVVYILQGEGLAVVLDEIEPVSSPGDIACDCAIAGDVDWDGGGGAVAGDVLYRDGAGGVEGGADDADCRFDAVGSGPDSAQMREGDDQSDGAVTAHAEVTDVIEEDDAGDAGGVDGFAEDGSDDDVGAARLVNDGGAEGIVEALEAVHAVGEWALAEVRASGQDEAGGLSAGVGVQDRDTANRFVYGHLQCRQS